LHDVLINPCILNGSSNSIVSNTFDRDYRTIADVRDRNDARTRRHTVHVHRARAARTDAATKLRSRHLQIFTQHPEQWRRGIDVHFSPLSVYG
jgi:hypothetical protein